MPVREARGRSPSGSAAGPQGSARTGPVDLGEATAEARSHRCARLDGAKLAVGSSRSTKVPAHLDQGRIMKRLGLLVLLLASLALPSLARGEAVITNSLGEAAAEIEGVSENWVIAAGGAQYKCATWRTTESITNQTSLTVLSHVTGTGEHEVGTQPHAGTCRVTPANLEVHVQFFFGQKHVSFNPFTSTTNYSYTTVTTHPILGSIQCTSEGTASISYVSGSDEMSFSGTFVSEGPACPPSGTVEGDFAYTDEFGEPVSIH
jgi:hypothetical protein